MNAIDYKSLSILLDKVIEEATQAKSECLKKHPDEVEICDHAVENLGRLYDQIESCVFSRDFRCMQVNNGIVDINVNFRQHDVDSLFERKHFRRIPDKYDLQLTGQDIALTD